MITILPIILRLSAPYMTRSSEPGVFGVDSTLMRNGRGQLVLPGSHVVGKIAQSVRDLAMLMADTEVGHGFSLDLKQLFAGDAARVEKEDVSGREDRRNLTASDFVLRNEPRPQGTRTRIARNNASMTVAEGMMQVLEQPFETDELLVFDGELRFASAPDAARLHRIEKALNYITQFGGLRTIGFGSVKSVVFGEVKPSSSTFSSSAPTRSLELVLKFNDPFCTGESRNDPNTYRSALHVPGGAIRGAIAKQLLAGCGLKGYLDDNIENLAAEKELAALAKNFSVIRVRHAMPVLKKHSPHRRMAVLPASLAAIDENGSPRIVDLAGIEDPSRPVLIEGQAPISMFDWKESKRNAAVELFNFERLPERELRIRTQIDEDSRASKMNRLFGVEYTRNDTHNFVARISLPEVQDQQLIVNGLQKVLENGLAGIGRGGAHADICLSGIEDAAFEPDGKRVVIVLQTAALLRSPATSGIDLRTDYEAMFREIGLPAHWSLKAVFVEEQLAGGGFMRNRLKSPMKYAPWLLTKPGSVFVLEREEAGAQLPSAWLASGLDVPTSVLEFHDLAGEDKIYRFCPYLPENGYGEISFGALLPSGIASHIALAPGKLGLSIEEIVVVGGDL